MLFQLLFLVIITQFIQGQEDNGYHFTKERKNYEDAVKYCESKSMKLPVIDNEASNKLVYDIAVRNGLGSYWINGNDIGYESDWKNTDGELIKFKPWHQVEPNGGRGENCIHGLFYPNGIWNDVSCGSTQAVICDPVKKQ